MIIKPFLSILLLGVLFFVMIQHHSGRLLRPAVAIAVAVGIFFTWMPEFSNKVANYLGIGRGAGVIEQPVELWIGVIGERHRAALLLIGSKQLCPAETL